MELPAALHRDLAEYGRIVADGATPIEPAKPIVPMLERFVATVRGFTETRRQERPNIPKIDNLALRLPFCPLVRFCVRIALMNRTGW